MAAVEVSFNGTWYPAATGGMVDAGQVFKFSDGTATTISLDELSARVRSPRKKDAAAEGSKRKSSEAAATGKKHKSIDEKSTSSSLSSSSSSSSTTSTSSSGSSSSSSSSSSTTTTSKKGVVGGVLPIKGLGGEPVLMPAVGFGTYKFKGGGTAQRATAEALKLGYRLIDTAFVYGGEKTEGEVGKALASSTCPVPRDEVFVVTKHWRKYHGYAPTLECLDKSLSRLGLAFVDLYLMHWPGPAYTVMGKSKAVMEASPLGPFVYAHKGHERENMRALRAETWRAMEDALKAGKCRAIGVSNMTVAHLEALKATATVWPPAVNQVEFHPYRPSPDLVAYCRKEGIVLQAYASLGGQDAGKATLEALGGALMGRPEVAAVADKHGRPGNADVLLRWATQRGIAVIPKSSSTPRMRSNLAAAAGLPPPGGDEGGGLAAAAPSFNLDDEDFAVLDGLVPASGSAAAEAARLCWKTDPLKSLDFE